jgi:hypothetical protein
LTASEPFDRRLTAVCHDADGPEGEHSTAWQRAEALMLGLFAAIG